MERLFGVISDTHSLIRPEALAALAGVERILHAGDVGSPAVLEALAAIAPVTAVVDSTSRTGGRSTFARPREGWSPARAALHTRPKDSIMERLTLSANKISPAAQASVAAFHRSIVEEVTAAVARDPVVVVGMAQNPFVKKARSLLDAEGIKFTYLEYGSYLSKWKERLAIKIWAGFPTFPMVFIDGTLIGGATELEKLRAEGKLPR